MFCGRLDPMARGKILLLINDECKKMPLYLNNNKTYQFEICFGFQTDTDDFLGLIENKTDIIIPNFIDEIVMNIEF